VPSGGYIFVSSQFQAQQAHAHCKPVHWHAHKEGRTMCTFYIPRGLFLWSALKIGIVHFDANQQFRFSKVANVEILVVTRISMVADSTDFYGLRFARQISGEMSTYFFLQI
jgi:hypothetical protein